MQEGSLAFVQMIKAAQAVREFKSEGLLYVAYLTGPTFGGVLASWGSLAHLTFGLPGAVVGFSGPRPVEITTGRRLPEGVQTTDNLLRHGIVDDVFPLDQLSARIDALLSSLEEHPAQVAAPPRVSDRAAGDAWRSVEASRDPSRPGARDLLDACGAELTFLRGDRCGGGDDRACIAAIGSLKGRPCIVIAQDRKGGARPGSMGAEGYRKALRAMDAAAQLRLPVVTIIDTPGVALTPKAEESGLSAVIARCLERMTGLGPPTLSLLLGQGAGGGALALFPADRVLAAEHAWLLPIAPEGASAIVLRSAAHAPELAAAQRGASWDLKQWGLVDAVVKEESGWVEGTAELIASELDALREESVEARLARRRRRLRALGNG
jgi:acetyl-CoA carboxylase alpha subunit